METKIKSQTCFTGKIFDVHVDEVRVTKTGQIAQREIVAHHGGVGIVALDHERILLVRQYRYAIGEYTLEIPAGKLEAGEDPQNCALREIEEETGYEACNIRHLLTAYATPGYCTEKLHIYLTDQVRQVTNPRAGDEDEDITYEWYDLSDCITMIKDGQITDAKTIIGILSIKKL